MPRPTKNYCDYFPHDRDMRNHRKVKAIRTKFGIEGYAIWSMLLEYLTGSDGNVFEYLEGEFELIGGDFGVSVETIRGVVDYCLKLELLFIKDGFIYSESLDERLKPVYEKRGKSKENSKKQQRKDGKFTSSNTVNNGVTVTETPQTKLNKTKLNKNIDKEAPKKDVFMQYVNERCVFSGLNYDEHKELASAKYDAWFENGWKDLNGNKIQRWQSKVIANLPFFRKPLNGAKNTQSTYLSELEEKRKNYTPISEQ